MKLGDVMSRDLVPGSGYLRQIIKIRLILQAGSWISGTGFSDRFYQVKFSHNFFIILHAFYFISNTFISNARLKFVNIQNISQKILRTKLQDLSQIDWTLPGKMAISQRSHSAKQRIPRLPDKKCWSQIPIFLRGRDLFPKSWKIFFRAQNYPKFVPKIRGHLG